MTHAHPPAVHLRAAIGPRSHHSVVTALGALLAIALLMVAANPAAAATGSGGGTGKWFVDSNQIEDESCAELTELAYESAVYEGTYTADTFSYVGPLTVELDGVDPDEDGVIGYINAFGTYEDPQCSTPGTLPVRSTVKAAKEAPTYSGGDVHCTYKGTFQRVGTDATVELDGSCKVKDTATGKGPSSRSATNEARKHELLCEGGHPPFTCDSTDAYTATNA